MGVNVQTDQPPYDRGQIAGQAGREGGKHHGSRLISSTEHREGRQHGPIETRGPRGRWCLANWKTLPTGGRGCPGRAGKPSVSWVHSVPVTLPLIPCFLCRDNIDEFVCVCVGAGAVSTGLIDFATTGICRGISSAGALSLRDFNWVSRSCLVLGINGF